MISLITVNYNSINYLKKLIDSMEKHLSDIEIELIVINNNKEKIDLPQGSIKKTIINKGANIGFGSANNLGAQKATGDWLLFINPDVEFTDNSLKKALEFLNKNKNISIIGPQIIQSSTGKPQPWTSGGKTSLMQIIFRNTIKKPWNSKKPILVDWVSGTALLIKNKLFNDIGGFDEAFFMYFEDQDICLRVKSKNTKTLFYPDFKIVHHSGKSWKKQKNQKKYYYQSQDIFFKKHHNLIQQKLLTFFRKTIKGY